MGGADNGFDAVGLQNDAFTEKCVDHGKKGSAYHPGAKGFTKRSPLQEGRSCIHGYVNAMVF